MIITLVSGFILTTILILCLLRIAVRKHMVLHGCKYGLVMTPYSYYTGDLILGDRCLNHGYLVVVVKDFTLVDDYLIEELKVKHKISGGKWEYDLVTHSPFDIYPVVNFKNLMKAARATKQSEVLAFYGGSVYFKTRKEAKKFINAHTWP